MKIIKPKKLKKGDTIAFIGISGKIKEYERLEKAKIYFEKEGYKVIISPSNKSSHRYMSGASDENCINTINEYFLNDDINAVICSRGGYGSLRLLNGINWNIIKKHPKIFAGYSDITALLNMIFKKTGLITFHSAMPNGDFSSDIQEYTKNSFFNTLSGNTFEYKSENNICYLKGQAKGRLIGGNLATLTSLCGLNFFPDEDLILFLEDLNEPSYKIDRMLTQLFNIKKFKNNIKGIALGDFLDVDNELFLEEILKEISLKLKIPICRGFKITHDKIKDTVPFGVKATLYSNEGIIKIEENYVI